MRIAYDAKRVTNNQTGLGNYSRFVVRVLAEHFPRNEYLLLSPAAGDPQLYRSLLEANACLDLQTPRSPLGRRLKTHWRNYGMRPLLRQRGVELYHGLSNELPMGLWGKGPDRPRTVVTIHDLAFLRHPAFYPMADRFLYRWKYGTSARAADRIIAVSEFTKQDIIRFLGVPEGKISVVYQGCSPRFAAVKPGDAEASRARYALPPRYMLFVGSIEERKNLRLAVEALARLDDKRIALVAVGRRTAYTALVQKVAHELGIADRLHIHHQIGTEDLPGVFAGAELFVYPSRLEGFGIPLLEALNARTPVIGATGSCLEEAGGAGSLYTDPDDPDMLAALMTRILTEPGLRERMIDQGLQHAKRFGEQRLAEDLMAVYRQILRQA